MDRLFDIDAVQFVTEIGVLLRDRHVNLPVGGTIRVARVEFDFDYGIGKGPPDDAEPYLRREGLDRDGPLVVAVENL